MSVIQRMAGLSREETKSMLQSRQAEIMSNKSLLRKLNFITKAGKKIFFNHLTGPRPNLGFVRNKM